jgi:hypothetical protein
LRAERADTPRILCSVAEDPDRSKSKDRVNLMDRTATKLHILNLVLIT